MCCRCCGETQRKFWVFGSGSVTLVIGILLVVFWRDLADNIVDSRLILKKGSNTYDAWVEAPIPIYLDFHMFHWANPQDIYNKSIKPRFVERGPYVFVEKHLKKFTFHDNNTVSYYQKRTWYFDAQQSNGSLDDTITMPHAITLAVSDQMRFVPKFFKKVINFMLNREGGELYTTRPVREWIFDGFQDNLTDFLNLFNTSRIYVPYTKFAWLADRNASFEYDGLFQIHTGQDDISKMGLLTLWNQRNVTGFYDAPCGNVNGSTGDLFPAHLNTSAELTLFVNDACRFMNLKPNGTITRHKVVGQKWIGTNETFASGDLYPNQKCFCDPTAVKCARTGVVATKKCRANSPVHISFPHFYLADESYVNDVEGVKPDPEKHTFHIAVEPRTGVPLDANGCLQINLLLEPDDSYDLFRGLPTVMLPVFWFNQRVELSKELASQARLAINLGDYIFYFGIFLIVLGATTFGTGIGLSITNRWIRQPVDDDDDEKLSGN